MAQDGGEGVLDLLGLIQSWSDRGFNYKSKTAWNAGRRFAKSALKCRDVSSSWLVQPLPVAF